MSDVVIASAARTPVGSFLGSLSTLPGHVLGASAIAAALKRAAIEPEEIDDVILGQVLTAGQGQNPARQAAIAAGIPNSVTAYGINQVCGSGLRAVVSGLQQITTDCAEIVVVGGQESMSMSRHCLQLRTPHKMGTAAAEDTMIVDGLLDAFGGYHMGITAETVATRFGITREAQDAFALASQQKAAAARAHGRFVGEIVPVRVSSGKMETLVEGDEHIRPDSNAEGLARLRPAFVSSGTVTAGNASGLADGAAAMVLMRGPEAARRKIAPLGRIAAWAQAGVAPEVMGLGPIPACQKVLDRAGWSVADVDLWEVNEAFAAQSLAVIDELGMDPARVNVNGGAIALGHPIGASGGRVLVTLLYEMQRRRLRRGIATLCIGGGMGIAMAVENA